METKLPQQVPVNRDWYKDLLEDIRQIFVEYEFAARWALVEGYHLVGKRILEDMDKFRDVPSGEVVQRIAEDMGKKTRTVWYTIQFARKYPDLNLLPEGKNTSWHAICNKYLPEPSTTSEEPKLDGEVVNDFDSLDTIMASATALQEELERLDEDKFDLNQDAKDYLLSQLRITAAKLNRFLITYDLSR